jgi:hypothetical protein
MNGHLVVPGGLDETGRMPVVLHFLGLNKSIIWIDDQANNQAGINADP